MKMKIKMKKSFFSERINVNKSGNIKPNVKLEIKI